MDGLKDAIKKKCIRRKTSPLKLSLGDDVYMADVIPLSDLALVGRFGGRGVSIQSFREWTKALWSPVLGYVLESYALTKGWFVSIFQNSVDACHILKGHWLKDNTPFNLTRWRPSFNENLPNWPLN